MKKRTLMIALAMLLVMAMVLSSCAPKAATQGDAVKETKEKVVRYSLDAEPPNMDPQIGTDLSSFFMAGHLLEGLVRVYDGKVQPGVAEKWEISPDGLVYTFHLRDTKWSDGVPVKAQDFNYAIKRLLDPKTAAGYAETMGFYIKNASKFYTGEITDFSQVGVKVIDDKTLEITLENPTGYFLRLAGFVCFLPTREDILTKYGEAYASEVDKMVYNGAYILKEWKHEQSIIFTKNPSYWDKDKVKVDTIEVPIIPDLKTALDMYEAGDLDYAQLPTEMVETYMQNGKGKLMNDGGAYYLMFNLKVKNNSEILGNKNFKKAFSYAIDREGLAKAVFKTGTPASRYIPDNISGLNGKFDIENPLDGLPIKADPAKAKEYFDLALKDLNLTVDKFPTLKLLGADSDVAKKYCEAVQDMVLKNLGIKLELINVPKKQRLQLVNDRDYEIAYANWYPDYDDPMTFLDLWITGGGFNRLDYTNPAYDAAIKEAKSTTDEKLRQQKMVEAEKILLEDLIVVPLHWGGNPYTVSDKLENFVRSLVGADPDFTYIDKKE